MFPIKYIDNNLVWNKDNEVFAYYELIPYNYSFLSAEQKFIVHDSFRQLIAQSREGKIHALQIATGRKRHSYKCPCFCFCRFAWRWKVVLQQSSGVLLRSLWGTSGYFRPKIRAWQLERNTPVSYTHLDVYKRQF